MDKKPVLQRPKAIGLRKLPKKLPYPDPPAVPGQPANGLSEQVRKPFELAMQKTAERMQQQAAEEPPPEPPPAG